MTVFPEWINELAQIVIILHLVLKPSINQPCHVAHKYELRVRWRGLFL